MKILGDKLGMKFDHSILFIKYIKIYMKYGIKLCNWKNCKEFIENPDMYDYFDLKNRTMVEIGVQYADFTAYFNKRYNTKIIGFDALIDTMSIRLENLMINKCKNVDIYNIIIGNGNNIKCFKNFDMVINENMLIDKNMNYKNYEIKEFKTEKLDELLKNEMSLKDFNIDIVKIDIEGNELYALEGMVEIINKYKPQFIIEVHSHKLFKDVYNFLNKFDYVIKSCRKLNNEIEILYMEVI